jgi:peptidoglycan/LPS O-acetylase OafA/YrhL
MIAMKRLLLFALLGPMVSLFVWCAIDRAIAKDILNAARITVPLMYAFAIGPLLLCAILDFYMEDARWWERLIMAAFAGFLTVTFAYWVLVPTLVSAKLAVLQVGLVGAIPAMLCSWLANPKRLSSKCDSNVNAL